MEINNRHIDIIISSLKYSIKHIKNYHEQLEYEFGKQGRKYDYDYQKYSIKPINDALQEIKNNLKNNK